MNINAYLVDFLAPSYLRHGVAALLVLCAGSIIWSMFPQPARTRPNVTSPVTLQARPGIDTTAEKIATAHLFGHSAVDEVNTAPAVTAATIAIEGLFFSTDVEMARAILYVDGKSGVFKTGDTLPDGEKLAAIGMNAVQIANGSALHEVELAQTFGNASPGIRLEGMPDLYAQQDSFPGSKPLNRMATPVVQRLQPVVMPQRNDPIAQMRALREQLIGH